MTRLRPYRNWPLFLVLMASNAIRCIGVEPGAPPVSPEQLADEYVQAALEAEGSGDFVKRQLMLASAAACAPNCPSLMWQLGYVQDSDGSWRSLEATMAKGSQDEERLNAYTELRSKMRDDLRSNLSLANWTMNRGLLPQARAHFERVLDFEPDHTLARRMLGYQLVYGEWIGPAEVKELIRQGMVARSSFELFGTKLLNLRKGMESHDDQRQQESREALFEIEDPQSIPAALSVFSTANERISKWVVQWLAECEDMQSSTALARYACFHPEDSVREVAVRELKQRPLHDFVPAILDSVSSPISMMAIPVFSDGSLVGYRQAFSRQAQDKNDLFVINTSVQRRAVPVLLNAPTDPEASGEWVTISPDEMPENRKVERKIREHAFLETKARQAAMNRQNLQIAHQNERAADLLSALSGKEFSGDPNEMWQWWDQYNETEYQLYKPTRNRRMSVRHEIPLYVGVAYAEGGGRSGDFSMPSGPTFSPGGLGIGATTPRFGGECFAAGTKVLTARGPRAIESICVGDIVFAKHVGTGALVQRPVLQTTTRPPRPTVLIGIGNEVLRCTTGHLFWVSGEGWTKASEIEKGDVLHGAEAPAIVTSIRKATAVETYNLEIADCGTYFVGSKRILSHDVTPRRSNHRPLTGVPVARLAK